MVFIPVSGTSGNDKIFATPLTEYIEAGAGNDTIVASLDAPNGGLADTIHGNDGNDYIEAATGVLGTVIYGDAGNDTIVGNMATLDRFEGGTGNDTYKNVQVWTMLKENAGEGTDTVWFDNGIILDSFTLGDNFENLRAENSWGAELIGNGLANGIVGNTGDDTIKGEGGNDTLDGGSGNDALHGGSGADQIFGGAGADVLNGDAGNDTLFGGAGPDTLKGGTGDDTYYVEASGDVIVEWSDGGVDTVVTAASNYTLAANLENVTYVGQVSFTGTGNAANNAIAGGGLQDSLSGLDGNDNLSGFGGNDTLHGGNGADTLDGGVGDDLLNGQAGNDSVLGGDGMDAMFGEGGNDTMSGGTGADSLVGGTGNDRLRGDDGNDVLTGGSGADNMAGGAGFDTFVYNLASESTGAAMDVILGFETGVDKLRLSAIDADTTMAGNQAFHMVSPGMFFASAGDLAIERSGFDSYVRGDLNGDSLWDLEIRVALNTTISAADIIL